MNGNATPPTGTHENTPLSGSIPLAGTTFQGLLEGMQDSCMELTPNRARFADKHDVLDLRFEVVARVC